MFDGECSSSASVSTINKEQIIDSALRFESQKQMISKAFPTVFGPRMECGIKGKNGCIIIYNYFPSACKMGL